MPWYSICTFLFYLCLFRSNVRKGCFHQWEWLLPMLWYFSKKPFRKLLDHNYVKFFFQELPGTLQLKILRIKIWIKILWIKTRADSFIKKQKSTKVSWKLSLAKNATPYFKEHCTEKDDISLVIICFFFSQQT